MEPKYTAEELADAIHAVLRGWHTGTWDEWPWRDMLVVRKQLAEQLVPDLELAVKQVLLQSLHIMEEQTAGDAQILRLRFLDGLTAKGVANTLNRTDNMVYKQQRLALDVLAALVEQAESRERSDKAAGVLNRLEIETPPRLFGVQEKLDHLLATLGQQQPPWLVAVVGIGGIGKTSLVDAAVRACAASPAYENIAWVSARQWRFTLARGLDTSVQPPALTFEAVVDALIGQLGFRDLAQIPLASKQAGLQARLKALPYLIVIDNLETVADYHALVPALQRLIEPTRFLLTSRHSLYEYPGVYNVSLDELSAQDSLSLLRHEAGERGLADVANASQASLAQVYEVAGGNPLALKLLLGQMRTLSLAKVVDNLRQARGRSVEDLFHFIYWRSWNLLCDEARQVLTIMPLVAESGGDLEQIMELCALPEDVMTSALQQLVNLNLVNVRGTLEARRYNVHRLTETFLLNEVLKWQTPI